MRPGMQIEAWRSGLGYSRAGVDLCRMRPQLFGLLTGLFCLPLALALALSVGAPEATWLGAATFVLTSVTVVGGGLTMMVAVDASTRGESLAASALLRRALGYLPRYLLTNAQTTLFFWSVMLPAIAVASRVTAGRPAWLAMVAWAIVVVLGIVCHLHTMFAPYLAICDGLPPPRAVVEGFRMTQRQLGTSAVTFVSAVAVVGLPLLVGLAALWAYASWEGPAAATRFDQALPYLMAGLVQMVRPVMVAAVHGLYADLSRDRPEAALA
jgi:hypothetical protein